VTYTNATCKLGLMVSMKVFNKLKQDMSIGFGVSIKACDKHKQNTSKEWST